MYELGHASRVLAQSLRINHPVEDSGQRLHSHPDFITVAVDTHILSHLWRACNRGKSSGCYVAIWSYCLRILCPHNAREHIVIKHEIESY